MKITYTGEYTSVVIPLDGGSGIDCPNGEAVEVPDKIANSLLKDQPAAWTAEKADKSTKAQAKRATTNNEE